MSSPHSTQTPKRSEIFMDYETKLKRLDEHLSEHPKDYQAVIAKLKTYSDAVEHKRYLQKVERMKKLAEYRRIYG